MRGFFKKLDELGANGDIWEARQHSAGNGALMRVAGAFLPHAWTLDEGLFDTVALTSAFTHDDATSTAACIAFTHILVKLLWFGPSIIKPNFFWETFVETARELEGNVSLKSRVPNDPFEGSLCDFIEQRLPAALKSGQSFASVNKSWYSGAYLLETVPIALFLLERYHHDPEEALVRAVMDTRDNDTIACIAGMVLGAVHGFKAWPERWRNDLSGCTQRDDFNRINHIYNMLRRFGGNGLKD
jgi:ADP-ribosylglycohydrolase